MISIAIVDDDPDCLRLTEAKIKREGRFSVAFTATNGYAALGELKSVVPDVVLMDIQMPKMDGISATKEMLRESPSIKIIMLTVVDDEEDVLKAIQAGAHGYLLKEDDQTKIVQTIDTILAGGSVMTPSIAAKALSLLRKFESKASQPKPQEALQGLTNRETQILQHLSSGCSYQDIAERLNISAGTVRKHIQNIYTKLQVNNKVQAINRWGRGF